MTQIAEAINSVPEKFLVFSGDDAVTLPVIALGGVGVVSVASNEIPHEMAIMTRARSTMTGPPRAASIANIWP